MTPEKVQPTYTVAQGEPVPQLDNNFENRYFLPLRKSSTEVMETIL